MGGKLGLELSKQHHFQRSVTIWPKRHLPRKGPFSAVKFYLTWFRAPSVGTALTPICFKRKEKKISDNGLKISATWDGNTNWDKEESEKFKRKTWGITCPQEALESPSILLGTEKAIHVWKSRKYLRRSYSLTFGWCWASEQTGWELRQYCKLLIMLLKVSLNTHTHTDTHTAPWKRLGNLLVQDI